MIGHVFLEFLSYSSNLTWAYTVVSQNFPALMIFACFYSVDVFFYLGGFFLAYVIAENKTIRKFNIKRPLVILITILHRLVRIWPAFCLGLFCFW